MKQILFLGIILLSALKVAGQVQNVDSLVNVLETQELTNKEQIELCYKIYERFIQFDLRKASVYAVKGLELAEKEGDKTMLSKFNASLGRIYNTKSSYDTAFVYWKKSLELALAANDKQQEAAVHVGIGAMYGRQEKQMFALEHFLKSLSIYESTGNKKKCIPVLGNIGSIYRAMDNNEKAVYYLEKAKNIAEETDDDDGIMQTCYELSAVFCTQEKYDQALEYAIKAYEISQKIENKVYQGAATEVLSAIYYDHLKDYDTAWKYSNECLQLAEEIGDPIMIAGAWKVISNINRAQKRYKESGVAARKALEADSTNINININLMENIVLADIFLENKEEAAMYFHKYIAIINKHINQSNREIFTDMETKYETEKKELRIVSLEKERRLYVWLGVVGVLLAVSLGIVLWQKIKSSRKEKQLIAANAVQDGEMGERARLARDLHDRLSGNLSAVKMELGYAGSLHDVSEKLDGCIEEIRRITHNLMPRSLQSGIKVALEDFTAQFPNVYFHFFGNEKRIRERLEFIIYCCANELVNNSLRHSGAANINVQLIQSDKHVSLTVQDDGCGFDEKSVSKGIGLKNIRDRVASCNGKIDIITSPGNGTETIIELKTGDA